jgi:guanine deaminase
MAVAASRIREGGTDAADPTRGDPGARVDFRTAFYLATAGGGAALGLPIGHFAPGMQFDAMAIDPIAPLGTIRLWPGQTGEVVLEKVLHTAARANIAAVWVAGRPVKP